MHLPFFICFGVMSSISLLLQAFQHCTNPERKTSIFPILYESVYSSCYNRTRGKKGIWCIPRLWHMFAMLRILLATIAIIIATSQFPKQIPQRTRSQYATYVSPSSRMMKARKSYELI